MYMVGNYSVWTAWRQLEQPIKFPCSSWFKLSDLSLSGFTPNIYGSAHSVHQSLMSPLSLNWRKSTSRYLVWRHSDQLSRRGFYKRFLLTMALKSQKTRIQASISYPTLRGCRNYSRGGPPPSIDGFVILMSNSLRLKVHIVIIR